MRARPGSWRCTARLGGLALLTFVAASACRPVLAPLQGYDVVRQPIVDCTLTGATSRDCVEDSVLAQQRVRGHWVFEHAPQESFTLTTEEGVTLPGIWFDDDGIVLNEPPCVGEGGLCYFARRKFESVDERQGGCTRFGELVAILRRDPEGGIAGIIGDQNGTDERCGTSTIVQRIDDVTGAPTEEPAAARAGDAE